MKAKRKKTPFVVFISSFVGLEDGGEKRLFTLNAMKAMLMGSNFWPVFLDMSREEAFLPPGVFWSQRGLGNACLIECDDRYVLLTGAPECPLLLAVCLLFES